MKKLLSILIIAVLLTGCSHRRPGGTSNAKGPVVSGTQASISANIDELPEKPWSRAAYDDILNEQILSSKVLSKGQKAGLRSKLAMYYSRSIVADMQKAMNTNCERSHSRLASAAKELREFKLAEGADDMLRRYDDHQAEMSFAAGIGARQKVNSWRDSYDERHEKNINSQVGKHRAQNPSCDYLRRAFSADGVKNAFNKRRQNYALDVARLYSERSEPWTAADERAVKILILSAVPSMPAEAGRMIDNYRDTHKKE